MTLYCRGCSGIGPEVYPLRRQPGGRIQSQEQTETIVQKYKYMFLIYEKEFYQSFIQ